MVAFYSILFERADHDRGGPTVKAHPFVADLNLDQIVDTVLAGKEEYDLEPFFYAPLSDPEAIRYRQEVVRDLGGEAAFRSVAAFAGRMRTMRDYLAQAEKAHYPYAMERWFLDAVAVYCDAVRSLVLDLQALELRSAGLTRFRDYLAGYTESAQFALLAKQTEQLQGELSSVKYCVIIKDNSVGVRKYESELDYSAMVEDTFARFQEGAAKDYRVKFPENRSMNHVEAQILDRVARLYPEVFSRLDEYTSQNRDYLDEKVAAFDREIQFYVAYLEHVGRLERAGLEFCLPEVTRASKQIYAQQAFDLALAHKLVGEGAKVVRNDFHLAGRERIIVVTGPNQGGKTTFARAFGQLHYLAGLGLPVPARKARLFLFDRLFTHFEREERVRNLRGKLHDDLLRLRDILDHATSDSIVIMNEPFASTTVSDAVFLGGKVMEALDKLDVLGVIVTFLDELTSMSDKAVSMVSMIAPEDPAVRSTYEIVRKPADGRAYALAIARKYRLTYDALKERLG